MKTGDDLQQCLTFINCQLSPAKNMGVGQPPLPQKKAVTISRQAGCGASKVAALLAEHLQKRMPGTNWVIFDRNLVEQVLEDHHLPKRLARFMPEDRISEMTDTMDELFGLHPPSWLLVRQTAETIYRLADLGNVILLGRAGCVVTARLKHVLQVRLVGSIEKRLERLQAFDHLTRKEALLFLRRADQGRKRYLKKYFNQDIDDPLLYHVVINTDLVSCEQAARTIGQMLFDQQLLPPGEHQPKEAAKSSVGELSQI